jgi:ABC-type nickel/cobalt efflux system permease component RcnA
VIFFYGILHAFGPDHLTAIADFAIGKDRKKTLMITAGFALSHGLTLFVFAKILQTFDVPEALLQYGDVIASSVILGIGAYLLWMVLANRIHLNKHMHGDQEHVHIWFGQKHKHDTPALDKTALASAISVGALMGIGGVRGMLITLAALSGQVVNFWMVVSFSAGVFLVFMIFGLLIAVINDKLLTTQKNVRTIFSLAGLASILVGGKMLLG